MSAADRDRILVFVPAYNCAKQVPRVLAQFRKPVARFVEEILVLDNGSTDGTVEAAIDAAGAVPGIRVTVARNNDNYGLGGSHKSAFAYAEESGFSHVIILHGDDQGDIGDIEPVLASGRHRELDAVLGARFLPSSRLVGYSRFRVFGNHVFNAIFSVASFHLVADLGSGLNIVARSAFTSRSIARHPDGLDFNVSFLLDMFDKKRRVKFFPISWREDDQVSNVKMASQAVRTLGTAAEYLFRRGRFRSEDHRAVARDAYTFTPAAVLFDGRRVG